MRVGITGANGFIGSHLVRKVISDGERPILFVYPGSDMSPLKGLEDYFEIIRGDIREPGHVEAFASRCQAIVHLAGFNQYWARDPRIFHEINVIGARNVARACMKHGVDRLVHVSSCLTLGASLGPFPRDEYALYNLHHIPFPYAQTKRAGEEEIRWWARRKGLPAVIVNPATALGDNDYGPSPMGRTIGTLSSGLWPVYVGGGNCFIDIHDLTRGIIASLERGRSGERYLLVGENMTNREFMAKVARKARVPLRPGVRVPKSVLKVLATGSEWVSDNVTSSPPVLTRGLTELVGRYLYFDGTKAQTELGFKAGPCDEAIGRAVRWFGRNKELRAKEIGNGNGSRYWSHGLYRKSSRGAPASAWQAGASAGASGKSGETAA